jgi:hypothetical protein
MQYKLNQITRCSSCLGDQSIPIINDDLFYIWSHEIILEQVKNWTNSRGPTISNVPKLFFTTDEYLILFYRADEYFNLPHDDP